MGPGQLIDVNDSEGVRAHDDIIFSEEILIELDLILRVVTIRQLTMPVHNPIDPS